MPIGGVNSYSNPYTRSDTPANPENPSGTEGTKGTTKDQLPKYTAPPSTNKNTLTMDSFMQLLATQMKNQDMSNPMSNSEMMGQLTSMATVQAMNTFTDLSTTQYAMSMIGQKVQIATTDNNKLVTKVGTVTGVDLSKMLVYIDSSKEGYGMGNIMQVGTIPEKEETKPDPEKPENPDVPAGPGTDPESPDDSSRMAAGRSYIPADKAESLADINGMPEDKKQALASANQQPEDKRDAGPGSASTTGPGVKV